MAGTAKVMQKAEVERLLYQGTHRVVEMTDTEATTLAGATSGDLQTALNAAVADVGVPGATISTVVLHIKP